MQKYSPYIQALDAIPVRHKEISVAGVHTAYWDYGPENKAVDLVMIHGFRGDHHGLEPIVAQLGPQLRVIIPDVPGFGASSELQPHNDIEAFSKWLTAFWSIVADPKKTCLLGHSFGSIVVSASVANGLPVGKIVLVNPIAANALAGPRKILTQMAVGYYKLSAKLPEAVGHWLLKNQAIVRGMSVAMAKTQDTGLRKWIHHQHKLYFSVFSSRKSLLEAFHTSVSNDVSQFVSGITQDVLLIVADKDDITALPEQKILARQFASADVQVIENVGHLVHYEAPHLAAQFILRFLSASNKPVRSPSKSRRRQVKRTS